jgi:hypothetical protein
VGLTHLLFVVAIVAAVSAIFARRLRRRRLRAAARTRPGATPELAIHIRSFAEMDGHLARRWCHCGGYLERRGEGSRDVEGRRFRVARLECQECEAVDEVYFDTTDLLH